jgi:hypothetical protein
MPTFRYRTTNNRFPCGNSSPHIVIVEPPSADLWNAWRTSSVDTVLSNFQRTAATDWGATFRTDVFGAPLFAWICRLYAVLVSCAAEKFWCVNGRETPRGRRTLTTCRSRRKLSSLWSVPGLPGKFSSLAAGISSMNAFSAFLRLGAMSFASRVDEVRVISWCVAESVLY